MKIKAMFHSGRALKIELMLIAGVLGLSLFLPSLKAKQQSVANPAAGLSFDVASVRPSQLRQNRINMVSPHGIDITGETLGYIISQAYQIPISQIESAPHLKGSLGVLYDIRARTERASSRAEILSMLRAVLHQRFGLVASLQPRTTAVYNLVVAKDGPRIKESVAGFEADTPSMNLDSVEGHGVGLSRLCYLLSGRLERPVVNQTGLDGLYEFRLKLNTLEERPGLDQKSSGEFWSRSSIFRDIQDQLGLKLEASRASVDYLIIEEVGTPSEN